MSRGISLLLLFVACYVTAWQIAPGDPLMALALGLLLLLSAAVLFAAVRRARRR